MTLFKSFSKKEISYAEWVQALLYSERNYTQVIKYPKMPGNVNATLLKFSMSFFFQENMAFILQTLITTLLVAFGACIEVINPA